MYCKKCGRNLLEFEKVCPECGNEIIDLEVSNKKDISNKNPILYILSIIFGTCSIIAWFLWIYLGYIISIIGIIISLKSLDKCENKDKVRLGLILNIIGLILTIVMHGLLVL